MDNIGEVVKAILIGIAVIIFFFNLRRGLIFLHWQLGEIGYRSILEMMSRVYSVITDYTAQYSKNLIFLHWQLGEIGYRSILEMMSRVYSVITDYTAQYSKKIIVLWRMRGKADNNSNTVVEMEKGNHNGSELTEVKQLYDRAVRINEESGDKEEKANAYSKYGAMLHDRGEFASAKEYINKALAVRMEIGDRKGEATDNFILGNVFHSLGEFHKAKECLEKALMIRKAIGDRKGKGAVYGSLGIVLHSLGQYEKAKECLEKAIRIRKATGDRLGEAADHGNLGIVFYSLGEYIKAGENYEKALTIFVQIGDREKEVEACRSLGHLFASRNDYHKAIEFMERALAIDVKIGDYKGEATSYENLGNVFQSLTKYHKSKECFEKALQIQITLLDVRGLARNFGNLGTVSHYLGEYDEAKECLEKALLIRKATGDRKGEAAAYGNLGTVFGSLGKYGKAREYYEEALAIDVEIGDQVGEATAYGNLGTVFENLGEIAHAEEYHQKALVIAKSTGDKEREASYYVNLGAMFQTCGEYEKAKECLEKAVTISMEVGCRNVEASSYRNLGKVYMNLGDYGMAKEYYEKALSISLETEDRRGEASSYRKLGTVFSFHSEYGKAKELFDKALAISVDIGNRQDKAADLATLGILFQSLGGYDKAEEYLEEALAISKDIGLRESEFGCYCHLTMAKLSQGKIQEASSCLLQSIDKCENLRNFLMNNDQIKISFTDRRIFPYHLLVSLFCRVAKTKEALYVAELGRARALADLMAAQYSVEQQISANPQSWVAIENIMKTESKCTCLYIGYYGNQLFLWILNTSGIVNFRKITVNENFFHPGVVCDLDDLFAKSFRGFGFLPVDQCEDRSLNRIQPSSKSFQQDSPVSLRLVESHDEESQDPEPSVLFYKLIITPVADLLEMPEIIVVPDRQLYQVPFASLRDENGNYLSEKFRIRITPSLTTLKLLQDSPPDYHSQTGALIVGDPEVGQVFYMGCIENFKPLPYAREEAETIGQLLGVQPLLGEEATKQTVLQTIHSVSLIHFAAHGNADRGEIALSPVRATHQVPQDQDYLLTMSDISQVQLRAKLVVLSCCHSAQGQIRAEGVVGIARAFLGAGARSVLVALWAIQDNATKQFMNRFYKHLSDRESASESLHEAMKWMRSNGYPEVCDWAPFVLIGDNVTFDFRNLK